MAHILVVDEDAQSRQFLRTTLEAAGHVVREAPNGQVGVRAYRQRPADLVLCDILLDELAGLGAILGFRRHFPKARVVAMHGGSSLMPLDWLRADRRFGALAFLMKPLDPTLLRETLDRVLRN